MVDLYGGMPDMDRIVEVCDRRGIALIEDAAEAAGATFGGRRAGGFGVASAFSFHGSKTLTTHEGGMVLTDDSELHARMITLRDHGQAPYAVGQFWNVEVAYKYKMSAMQAAMGRVQLQRIDELVGRKREIFRWYEERLGGQEGLELNHEPPGVHNVYWMTTVVPDERFGVPKGELAEALNREGVTTRPFFWPLSALPAYSSTPGAAEAHARNRVERRPRRLRRQPAVGAEAARSRRRLRVCGSAQDPAGADVVCGREAEERMFEADTAVSAESIMGIFDDPRYSSLAQGRAAAYAAADPFPHTVIDDFLPESVARTITHAFPGAKTWSGSSTTTMTTAGASRPTRR